MYVLFRFYPFRSIYFTLLNFLLYFSVRALDAGRMFRLQEFNANRIVAADAAAADNADEGLGSNIDASTFYDSHESGDGAVGG